MPFTLILSALLLSGPVTQPASFPDLNADLSELFEIAGRYPPTIPGPDDRKKAEALWHRLDSELPRLAGAYSDNYDLELALGLLYRCGYNLDLPEASSVKKVICHFNAAAALAPDLSRPHLEAGEFLINAGRFVEGKRELDLALTLADPARQAIIHNLCFATYYLGDYRQAVAFCTQALVSAPDHRGLKLILSTSQGVLNGGPPPLTITIPAQDVPDGKLVRVPD